MTAYVVGFVLIFLLTIGYISLTSQIMKLRRELNFEYATLEALREHEYNSDSDIKLLFDYLNVEKINVPPRSKLQPKTKLNGETQ